MHEVDEHILEAAKQVDCSFVEEKPNFGSWKGDEILEFLIRAIWLIEPVSRSEFSSAKTPPSINGKFTLAQKVSEKLNKLGVSPGSKLTEQSLLYGELTNYRRIFLDVIRLFPSIKDQLNDGDQEEGLLRRAVIYNSELEEWVPQYCRQLNMHHKGLFWYPGAPELYPFNSKKDDSIDPRSFVLKLLTGSDAETSIKKPSLPPKPKIAPKPKELSEVAEIKVDLKQKEIDALTEELRQAQLLNQKRQEELYQVRHVEPPRPIVPISEELIAGLEEASIREKLLNYLQNVDSKVKVLEKHWEEARTEKMEQLEETRKQFGYVSRLERLKKKKDDYLKSERDTEEQTEQAGALISRLQQRMAKMPADAGDNRDKITKRLFEMMASLQKQEDELNRVLADNAALQKEMNWTSQALYRSFAIIENTLYKIHETYKGGQMYRTFSRINLTATASVSLIEKHGTLLRQIEKLTDQLEVEKQKCFSARLERMMADLDLVRQENAELAKQLRH